MKRKIFFSKRISHTITPSEVLNINKYMSEEEVSELYINKIIDNRKYIHNGPWVLRPVINRQGTHADNFIPETVTPKSVWNMVKKKLESSDALVAVISLKAYGTIVEVGYAVGLGKIAVYVLPDFENNDEATLDLWFSFQLAYQTRRLWKEEDILYVDEFKERGIKNIKDYEDYIESLIPPFLRKKQHD